MDRFIPHYNNKFELINLDLIESIYAVTGSMDDGYPIKDSDSFYTLILNAPCYGDTMKPSINYTEKFETIEQLKARIITLRTH